MNQSRPIATIRKNNAEEIRVSLVEHDRFPLVDVRVFAATRNSQGEPKPTRAGICLPRNRLPALIEALQAAAKGDAAG